LPGAVDRLRSRTPSNPDTDGPRAVVLAATDPANPYGAALSWPPSPGRDSGERDGHRPGRKAGALVVLVDGELAVYVERGGRTLLSFDTAADETSPEDFIRIAVEALVLAVRDGWLGRLDVERADGGSILQSPLGNALEAAGFRATPKGLRLRM
jgi:ATP-dependent helicase Lhr and Lhr-like helicase